MSKLLRVCVRTIAFILAEEQRMREQNTEVKPTVTNTPYSEEFIKSITERKKIRKELKKKSKTDTFQDVFDAVKSALQNP